MNRDHCCTLDDFYKALADETRQGILVLLKDGEMSAGELTTHFTLSQPTLSHHLAILRRVNLVLCQQRSNSVPFIPRRTAYLLLSQSKLPHNLPSANPGSL